MPAASGSGGTTNNTVFGVQLMTTVGHQPQLDPTGSRRCRSAPRGPHLQPGPGEDFECERRSLWAGHSSGGSQPMLPIRHRPHTICQPTSCIAVFPTNPVVNFQKCNFRVPEDVNDPNNPNGYTTPVTIYVARSLSATNHAAITLHYRVNNFVNSDADPSEEWNNWFPLQPGSDYAVPTPPTYRDDFWRPIPTLTWSRAPSPFPPMAWTNLYMPITFTVTNSTLTKFNRDFKIELYQEISLLTVKLCRRCVGMVAETTVTILFNDQHPPAGSVDELYNADFNGSLALPPTSCPDHAAERSQSRRGRRGEQPAGPAQ